MAPLGVNATIAQVIDKINAERAAGGDGISKYFRSPDMGKPKVPRDKLRPNELATMRDFDKCKHLEQQYEKKKEQRRSKSERVRDDACADGQLGYRLAEMINQRRDPAGVAVPASPGDRRRCARLVIQQLTERGIRLKGSYDIKFDNLRDRVTFAGHGKTAEDGERYWSASDYYRLHRYAVRHGKITRFVFGAAMAEPVEL